MASPRGGGGCSIIKYSPDEELTADQGKGDSTRELVSHICLHCYFNIRTALRYHYPCVISLYFVSTYILVVGRDILYHSDSYVLSLKNGRNKYNVEAKV